MQRVLTVSLLLILCGAAGAQTQDSPSEEPAKILPAETGSFIQINDLAKVRKSIANDPVLCHLLRMLPHERHRAAWVRFQQSLDLSEEQIVDRYLGTQVVIVGPRPGWDQPLTMMLRVGPADSSRLVKALALKPRESSGSFQVFSTPDNQTRIAVSRQWVSIARSGVHEEYMRTMLSRCGKAKALSDDPEYRNWVARLPKERTAVAFFRGQATGHNGAAALVNQPTRFSIHYVGRPADGDSIFADMGEADAMQFGPLPRETVAAATINLLDRRPTDVELLDRLLAPLSYEKDIASRIEAPVLLFVGAALPADDPAALPCLGGAVRLRDATVAKELSQMIDNAMLVASVSASKWGAPPILTQSARHGEHSYRIAEVGVVLSKRFGRDELMQVRLSYGAVGDWYLVASSERFFNRCLDAVADPDQRLTSDPSVGQMPLRKVNRSIATFMVRGKEMQAVVQRLQGFLNSAAELEPQAPVNVAGTAEGLPDLFKQCQSLTAQFHRAEDDEQLVIGKVDFVRK